MAAITLDLGDEVWQVDALPVINIFVTLAWSLMWKVSVANTRQKFIDIAMQIVIVPYVLNVDLALLAMLAMARVLATGALSATLILGVNDFPTFYCNMFRLVSL